MMTFTNKDFDQVKFPDGSVKLVVKDKKDFDYKMKLIKKIRLIDKNYKIDLIWNDFKDVNLASILIQQATHIIGKNTTYSYLINVHLPYLPYSRQDKEFNKYECEFATIFLLSLIEGCCSINKFILNVPHCDFDKIPDYVSKVSLWAFEINENTYDEMMYYLNNSDYVAYDRLYLFPDKSAKKRTKATWSEFSYYVKANNSIELKKNRNKENGSLVFEENLSEKDIAKLKDVQSVIIIDDICSKGGTFLKAKEIIRKYNKKADIHLVVNAYEGTADEKFIFEFKKVWYNINIKTGEKQW
jgi:phosphoribosylpyrophosphate synthetase